MALAVTARRACSVAELPTVADPGFLFEVTSWLRVLSPGNAKSYSQAPILPVRD